jgi:hypothetical protein
MKRLRWVSLALVLSLSVPAFSSCASVKTNPSQTEQQHARDVGVKILSAIKQATIALRAVQDLEISFHDAKTITDADHRRIQQAFLVTFQTLDVAVTQIGAATTTAQLQTTLTTVKTTVASLSQALATSAPAASKALQTAAAGIGLAIDVALSLIGS